MAFRLSSSRRANLRVCESQPGSWARWASSKNLMIRSNSWPRSRRHWRPIQLPLVRNWWPRKIGSHNYWRRLDGDQDGFITGVAWNISSGQGKATSQPAEAGTPYTLRTRALTLEMFRAISVRNAEPAKAGTPYPCQCTHLWEGAFPAFPPSRFPGSLNRDANFIGHTTLGRSAFGKLLWHDETGDRAAGAGRGILFH